MEYPISSRIKPNKEWSVRVNHSLKENEMMTIKITRRYTISTFTIGVFWAKCKGAIGYRQLNLLCFEKLHICTLASCFQCFQTPIHKEEVPLYIYGGRRLVLSNYPLFYLLKVIFSTTKTACPAHNFCEQAVLKNTCLTETFYNCSFDYIRFSPLFCTAYAMGTSRLVFYSNQKAKST